MGMAPDFQFWVNFRMSIDDTRVDATQVVGANAFGRVPETGGGVATFWRELLCKVSLVEEGQEEAAPEETLESRTAMLASPVSTCVRPVLCTFSSWGRNRR